MSRAGCTPGPWIADFHRERLSGGRYVVGIHKPGELNPIGAVTTGVEGYGREEGRANALLIAAAPDLYEALSNLMENPLFQTAVGGNPSAVEAMLDHARAALTKARGETA